MKQIQTKAVISNGDAVQHYLDEERKQWEELDEETAMSKEDVELARSLYTPFLKVFLILAYAYEHKLPKEYLATLTNAQVLTGARGFMARYGFKKSEVKAFDKMVSGFLKTKDYDDVEDEADDVAAGLKSVMDKIARDNAVPRDIIDLLKDVRLYIHTDSESAFNRIHTRVSALRDPALNNLYTAKSVEKPDNAKKEVQEIVRRMTGKPGLNLTQPQIEELRTKKPAQYKAYLEARRGLVALTKKRVAQLVRGTGKHLVDAKTVVDKLLAEGFVSTIPQGFVGQVDENGKLYTTEGKQLLGVPGGSVKMNPKYDPKKDNSYVLTAVPFGSATGLAQRVYTVDYRQAKTVEKFKKVEDVTDMIDTLRAKWGKDLMSDSSRNQIAALILETAYQTHGRIGNKGNMTDGKNTYGLSTLLGKHVGVVGNKIKFAYLGKSGIKQVHQLLPVDRYAKKAIQIIAELKAKCGPNETLFNHRGHGINGAYVNTYLKSLGSPVTIHKIRTLKGTLMAEEILKKSPFAGKKNNDPKKVSEWLKKQLTAVGKSLGHMSGDQVTPMTAIKSYIDSDIIQDFYDKAGVRPPAQIEKIIKQNTELK